MSKKLHLGSQVVHAGLPEAKPGNPFMQGPTFASTYHLPDSIDSAKHQYARFSNPTWDALEQAIEQLEHGESVIFPSGMAASAAIMSALLKSGDTVVLPADGYYATRAYAETFLVPNGIHLQLVNTNDLLSFDFSGVTLVLIESPSNPLLDVVDIAKLAQSVHKHNGILAIDNTTITVLGQQPLLLGADISMSADTKAFNGHSDVVFGHVASSQQVLIDRIRLWRKLAGNIPGPMETWLVHRGLATLDLRLERMVNNAQAIAELLVKHEKVGMVRYPGLTNDPSHTIAKQQMQHFGFVISFDLVEEHKAQTFLNKSNIIFEATSFGGVHTMAERRARWGTDNVSPGLIRLSVGCERLHDLVEDINLALSFVE